MNVRRPDAGRLHRLRQHGPRARARLGRARAVHRLRLGPRRALAAELGGEALASNRELAERADVVVLAHKPAQLAEVACGGGGLARRPSSRCSRARRWPTCAARTPAAGRSASSRTRRSRSRRGVWLRRARRRRDRSGAARRVKSCFGRVGAVVEVPEHLMSRRRRAAPASGPPTWRCSSRRRSTPPCGAGCPPRRRSQLVTETMAGTAELLRARGGDTLARAPRGRLARRHDRPRPGRARARRRARGLQRRDGRGGRTADARRRARSEIADFLAALICVYTIIIIAWIVVSLVFSLGARVPYSRLVNAVLDFLRDVTEPYLRIFRRLPLRIGPLDLSPDRGDPRAADRRRPIVVSAIDRRCRRPATARAAAGRGRVGRRSTRPSRRSCARRSTAASASTCSSASSSSTCATAASRSACSPAAARCSWSFAVAALTALLVFFARHRDRPLVWLPTGLLLGGAVGNLIDRVREGRVTDFIKLPPGRPSTSPTSRSRSACSTLLYVLEGPPRHGRR